jgi:beta-N-acetylhexosaminidase
VTKAADLYCATLMMTGVHCTLKHFPGLGRVYDDTHKLAADLAAASSSRLRRARFRQIWRNCPQNDVPAGSHNP